MKMKCQFCWWRSWNAVVFLRTVNGILSPSCNYCHRKMEKNSGIFTVYTETKSLEAGMAEWERQCEEQCVREVMES